MSWLADYRREKALREALEASDAQAAMTFRVLLAQRRSGAPIYAIARATGQHKRAGAEYRRRLEEMRNFYREG